MRQFIKFTFASCLGVFLALTVVTLFFVMLGVAATMQPVKTLNDNSILEIALDYSPPEQTNNVQTGPFEFKTKDVLGVQEIVRLIEHAQSDEKISGILLDPSMIGLGPSNGKDVLRALTGFREAGKFIVTYADFYDQGGYYLASASDHIIINPIGSVDFRGFSSLVPFYKDLLDKTGVKMQIYYAGQFKSATEPFRRNDMSPQNKLQTREYLEDVYGEFLTDISMNRKMPVQQLRSIADGLKSTDAEAARALGLVDQIGYEDEAIDWIQNQLELDSDTKPRVMSIEDYHLVANIDLGAGSDRIAVVTAEGSIIHGEEEYGVISDGHFAEVLSKVRKSKSIKAVVLRVNSPGGNILAAENILREVKLIQEAGKPVVVSMSDYAASGGYYISATADSIFAQSNTLTGSIGVFTMIPNPHQLLNETLGIHFDTVRTARYSASFTPFFDWSSEEHEYFESRTDDFYTLFLEKVAEGRDMTVEEVNEVAQGRIWTGKRAVENGLVDRIANLDEAVVAAANLAGLEDYRVSNYPKLQDPWTRVINEITNPDAETKIDSYIEQKLKQRVPHFEALRELIFADGPVARLPVVIDY